MSFECLFNCTELMDISCTFLRISFASVYEGFGGFAQDGGLDNYLGFGCFGWAEQLCRITIRGGEGTSRKQIPSLRYGMTNEEASAKG